MGAILASLTRNNLSLSETELQALRTGILDQTSEVINRTLHVTNLQLKLQELQSEIHAAESMQSQAQAKLDGLKSIYTMSSSRNLCRNLLLLPRH